MSRGVERSQTGPDRRLAEVVQQRREAESPYAGHVETPAELAARFDERAPTYDDSAMHRGLAQAVADFVRLGGVRDILDVGTGTGLVLRSLPPGPWRLTGIDLSEGMLSIARAALPRATFEIGDATHLGPAVGRFDVVICSTVLHLVPDPPAAMREWRRVLRAGGCIVVASFADDSPARHGRAGPEVHAPFGSPEALDRLGEASGLVVDRIAEWQQAAADGTPEYRCLITEFVPAGR
jgi:SAM-dependent methyltransferase